MAACHPEQIIKQSAGFSAAGITRGEQGLVVSLNTRWLSHYVRLRQLLGVEPVRYKFGPTSHGKSSRLVLERDRIDIFKETGQANRSLTRSYPVEVGPDGEVEITLTPIVGRAILQSKIGPNEIHLYESRDHYRNFIDCVISRKEPVAPVETAHRSITICHLGNIAMRLGRKSLKWDPDKEQIVGDPEAAKMLSRPYRAPWSLQA
jgi:hypothetical protein